MRKQKGMTRRFVEYSQDSASLVITTKQIMSYNTTKITVFNEEKAKDEDVKLFYSTITDSVGITCDKKYVFLTRGQFEALAYLMRRCFYTRQMLDEAHQILDKEKCPYTVYSSKDDDIWDVEIEKD